MGITTLSSPTTRTSHRKAAAAGDSSVSSLNIADLRVHSIAIADPPLRSSYGLHAPYALRNVLELESEDGRIGIAETYGGEGPAAALRGAARAESSGPIAFRITATCCGMVEGEGGGLARSQTDLVPGRKPTRRRPAHVSPPSKPPAST